MYIPEPHEASLEPPITLHLPFIVSTHVNEYPYIPRFSVIVGKEVWVRAFQTMALGCFPLVGN